MANNETNILIKIKKSYQELNNESNEHLVVRGGINVILPPNRESFIVAFDKLINSVVELQSLNFDYVDKQTIWDFNTLNNNEVQSLRSIKNSTSARIESKNLQESITIMNQIVNRLTKFELSGILGQIDKIESNDKSSEDSPTTITAG